MKKSIEFHKQVSAGRIKYAHRLIAKAAKILDQKEFLDYQISRAEKEGKAEFDETRYCRAREGKRNV